MEFQSSGRCVHQTAWATTLLERVFTKTHLKKFSTKWDIKPKKDGGEDFCNCMKFIISNSL